MAIVKSQTGFDAKTRFMKVLEVLSRNPEPLSPEELAAILRASGYKIAGATPRKWTSRRIPGRWARRIAELPDAKAAGLTAAWMVGESSVGPTERAKMAPDSLQGLRLIPRDTPSTQPARSATASLVVAVPEAREASAMEPWIVLADRLAALVRTLVLSQELHSPRGAEALHEWLNAAAAIFYRADYPEAYKAMQEETRYLLQAYPQLTRK